MPKIPNHGWLRFLRMIDKQTWDGGTFDPSMLSHEQQHILLLMHRAKLLIAERRRYRVSRRGKTMLAFAVKKKAARVARPVDDGIKGDSTKQQTASVDGSAFDVFISHNRTFDTSNFDAIMKRVMERFGDHQPRPR